jgi:hypothetical protein
MKKRLSLKLKSENSKDLTPSSGRSEHGQGEDEMKQCQAWIKESSKEKMGVYLCENHLKMFQPKEPL